MFVTRLRSVESWLTLRNVKIQNSGVYVCEGEDYDGIPFEDNGILHVIG